MAIEWPSVIATMLGSGVVAAGVTQGIAALREHAKGRADARIAALSISVALELFGTDCAERAVSTSNFRDSGGRIGTACIDLPPAQILRTNTDINLLPLWAASLFLEFEACVVRASADLHDDGATNHIDLAVLLMLRLGERSFRTADKIRHGMGLPGQISGDLEQRRRYLSEEWVWVTRDFGKKPGELA